MAGILLWSPVAVIAIAATLVAGIAVMTARAHRRSRPAPAPSQPGNSSTAKQRTLP